MNYYNNKIYIYGGEDTKHRYFNDLWIYTLNTKKWTKIKPNIKLPTAKYHRTLRFKNYILLFGGLARGLNKSWFCMNELYMFNITTQKWKHVPCTDKPLKRYYHELFLLHNHLIVHGGVYADGKVVNQSMMLNLEDILLKNSKTGIYCWQPINPNLPSLYGHNIHVYRDKVYCFAGKNSHKHSTSILYATNIDIDDCSEIITDIDSNNNNNSNNESNINNNKLRHANMHSIVPRYLHSSCLMNIEDKLHLFAFGGDLGNRDFLDDGYIINIDKMKSSDNLDDLLDQYQNISTKKLIKSVYELTDNNKKTTQKILQLFDDNISNEIKAYQIAINDLKNQTTKGNDDEKESKTMPKDMDKQLAFKEYFGKKFDIEYYDIFIQNKCNTINKLINVELDDLKEVFNIKQKFIQKAMMDEINLIKNDRILFRKDLQKIHMDHYLETLDECGIYTWKVFYTKIHNATELFKIIHNKTDSQCIFKNSPKYKCIANNKSMEGKETPLF